MNQTPKEKLIFTLLMVFFMATILVSYNAVYFHGFTLDALRTIALQIVPMYIIAFALEWFFVGKTVFKIHSKITKPTHHPLLKLVAMAMLFVTFMSALMSAVATFFVFGTEGYLGAFLAGWARNWPVALVVQLLIAGPSVRFIHKNIFKKAQATA